MLSISKIIPNHMKLSKEEKRFATSCTQEMNRMRITNSLDSLYTNLNKVYHAVEGLEAKAREDHEAGLALLKSLSNEVILGEEVASKLTVFYITKQICDAVQERTEKGAPKRGFGFSLWKKATSNDNEEDEVYDLITIDPKPFPPPMKLCKDMVEAMGGAERLLNRDDTKEENISMDEAEEDGFLKLFNCFQVSTTNGKHLCEKGNLKPLLNREAAMGSAGALVKIGLP
ncbi:hypothetical protein Tco_0308296 [Tanacetum coccineum]